MSARPAKPLPARPRLEAVLAVGERAALLKQQGSSLDGRIVFGDGSSREVPRVSIPCSHNTFVFGSAAFKNDGVARARARRWLDAVEPAPTEFDISTSVIVELDRIEVRPWRAGQLADPDVLRHNNDPAATAAEATEELRKLNQRDIKPTVLFDFKASSNPLKKDEVTTEHWVKKLVNEGVQFFTRKHPETRVATTALNNCSLPVDGDVLLKGFDESLIGPKGMSSPLHALVRCGVTAFAVDLWSTAPIDVLGRMTTVQSGNRVQVSKVDLELQEVTVYTDTPGGYAICCCRMQGPVHPQPEERITILHGGNRFYTWTTCKSHAVFAVCRPGQEKLNVWKGFRVLYEKEETGDRAVVLHDPATAASDDPVGGNGIVATFDPKTNRVIISG